MKREIKFRGLRTDGKGWVYGFYFKTESGSFIGEYNEEVEVIPETIGQFTGLKDKNGVEIYEGDRIRDYGHGYSIKFGSYFWQGTQITGFFFNDNNPFGACVAPYQYEVIGNIHENTLTNKES